jgi:hypothetical protein
MVSPPWIRNLICNALSTRYGILSS